MQTSLLNQNVRNRPTRPVKWRMPSEEGWIKVSIDKIPTYYLICLINKFAKKGYSKIRGLMSNEDAWMLQYVSELETEFDKRIDVDEYL